MSERRSQQTPEDIRRKLSKTVLHAAEQGRRSLFEVLTSKNADKIEAMLQGKPIQYEHKEDAPTELLIDEELAKALPDEFFSDPTAWIEGQPTLSRLSEGIGEVRKISEYWQMSYDATKVKAFTVAGRGLVSKRIVPGEVTEVSVARKAYAAGIPTPRVLAEIAHQGNIYAWFERIHGRNLNSGDRYHDARKEARGWFFNMGLTNQKFVAAPLVGDLVEREGTDDERRVFAALRSRGEAIRRLGNIVNDVDLELSKIYGLGKTSEWVATLPGVRDQLSSETRLRLPEAERVLGLALQEFYGSIEDFYSNTPYRAIQAIDEEVDLISDGLIKLVDDIEARDPDRADILKRRDEIVQMCDERGFTHKDSADRNFVVATSEGGKALRDEAGKPMVYIVDWEPKPSSERNKKIGSKKR